MIVLAWIIAANLTVPHVFPDFEDCRKVAKHYVGAQCLQVKVYVDAKTSLGKDAK
jgi:hypothetical protein